MAVSVIIDQSTAFVAGGGTVTFQAIVTATASEATTFTWSVAAYSDAGGSINSSGVFTAPAATSSDQYFTVVATSTADTTKTATAGVIVKHTGSVPSGITVLPRFTSLSNLDSGSTFLSYNSANGGGISATTQGTSGTGYISFPAAIDFTQKGMLALLFQYNGETSGNLSFKITDTTDTANNGFYGGLTWDSGQVACQTACSLGDQTSFQPLQVPNGGKIWFYMAWTGFPNDPVTIGHSPDGGYPLSGTGSTYGNMGLSSTSQTVMSMKYFPKGYYAAGGGYQKYPFKNRTRIKITGTMASSQFLGYVLNQGGLESPSDSRMWPVRNVKHYVSVTGDTTNGSQNYDTTPYIRIPQNYNSTSNTTMCLMNHQNGGQENFADYIGSGDAGVAYSYLVANNYSIGYVRGGAGTWVSGANGNSSYFSSWCSNWGSDNGLLMREQFLTDVKSLLPYYSGKTGAIGTSMGGINSLLMYKRQPSTIGAIAMISPVTNLADCYNNSGFSTIINTAYGVSALNQVPSGKDPSQDFATYASIPIKMWYGVSDPTLRYQQNGADFINTLRAAPYNNTSATLIAISNPTNGWNTHIGAGLYDGPAIVAFFNSTIQATVTSVTVSPSTASLSAGGTQTFTATVVGTGNPSTIVNWSASAGSITSAGVYTAPAATASIQTITVTATSAIDSSKTGTATITVPAQVPISAAPSVSLGVASGVLRITRGTVSNATTYSLARTNPDSSVTTLTSSMGLTYDDTGYTNAALPLSYTCYAVNVIGNGPSQSVSVGNVGMTASAIGSRQIRRGR